MWLVTPEEMQRLDQRTIYEAKVSGSKLMERAGTGVVTHLLKHYGPVRGKNVVVYCGKGNNGGDGLVVARLLQGKGSHLKVVLMAPYKDLSKDAKTMYQRLKKKIKPSCLLIRPNQQDLESLTHRAHILVDALLGTGLSATLRDPYTTTITIMNRSDAFKVAIDIPSGLQSETGAILGTAVQADLTVTFGCPKIGLYVGEAIDHAGKIEIVDIGVPPEFVEDLKPQSSLLTQDLIQTLIPRRPLSTHKGSYGHAGIVAGSSGKTGAPVLAALGALRAGTGLVTVATPQSVTAIVESKLLECMTQALPENPEHLIGPESEDMLSSFCQDKSALAFGPGLGVSPSTANMLAHFLPQVDAHCVLDADVLNNLASYLDVFARMKRPPVLTPHPGEMARLLSNSSSRAVNKDRIGIAKDFAINHRVILVLKGARTVIADPSGKVTICPTGNPGMASGGMGDVLTGVITGFLAQGLSPWDAARAGVYVHGLAGDRGSIHMGEAGLIASDVISAIPGALIQITSR